MAIFGYARGDTTSLLQQRQRITAYADGKGWDLSRMFADNADYGSVAWEQRPAGRKLFAELRCRDAVIVVSMDCVFPDLSAALTTIETLTADGISLYLLDLGGDVTGEGDFLGDRALVTTILRAFTNKC